MTLQTPNQTSDRPPRLTAADWVEAALGLFSESGIEAVQITALSRRLSVTRGSFYWHFDSRDALLDALLAEWRARNTGVMMGAIADTERLDDGVLALFSVWVDHSRFDMRLDQAVRDWSRRDARLRHIVRAEDTARVAAIAAFFERHGYGRTDAFIRARVIYFTQISYYALDVEEDEPMADRLNYLEAYFRCFTGREIAPEIAAAHRDRALKRRNGHE